LWAAIISGRFAHDADKLFEWVKNRLRLAPVD